MEISDIQKRVLRYIQKKHDWCTVSEIAEGMDVHTNSIRAALTKLSDKGILEKQQHRDGKRGRPTYVFRARNGRYTALRDAMVAFDGASPEEQLILEALITGKFEGVLEDTKDLQPSIVSFLKTIDVDSYLDDDQIHVTACPFRELNGGEVGYTCRIHRLLIQQAIGGRGVVQLTPLHSNGECRIMIREAVDSLDAHRSAQPREQRMLRSA
ncbi:MAG: hypothetical protein PUK40_01375 [Actinomycetaceae bacterium]|nr:hypothetical protein [Arcanobacterium sp.]MDD7504593.1 hypothetical protein [Actinomycetaceae bacterium]